MLVVSMQIWYLVFQLLLHSATTWTGGEMLLIFSPRVLVDDDLEREIMTTER